MKLIPHLLDHAPIEPTNFPDAREAWREFRLDHGWRGEVPILTPPNGNHKLMKSAWPTYAVSLAPARESGHNVCPFSTPKCRAGCIAFAGKGDLATVKRARITKTEFLAARPREFVTLVAREILDAYIRHEGSLAVRLNNFSDIPWERVTPWLFAKTPRVQFYDYTKDWFRTELPDNYWLTYSVSERTREGDIEEAIAQYRNVAVVFDTPRSQPLPTTYQGIHVVDGDKTDERFLDPKGYVVGLRAKGRMRKPEFRGFVKSASPYALEVAA